MSIDAKVTIQLLKVALGNADKVDYDMSEVNWTDVIDFATNQGVLGVCFDAFEKLPEEKRPDIDNLMEWLGQTSYMESQYKEYEDAVLTLVKSLTKQYLHPLVLKGYGCSLNYPVPNRRPCGDIDIYILNDKGVHAANIMQFAEQLLLKDTSIIEKGNAHHSVFKFKGFTVENHKTILDVNVHKSSHYLNELLETLARKCMEGNKSLFFIPNTKFNCIHLLRHMASDFATVTTSLRHILDWSTFISRHNVDWNFVHEVARKTNMNNFLDAINGICVHYLGYPKEMFPIHQRDERLEHRVLNDILYNTDSADRPEGKPSFRDNMKYGFHKTTRLFHNRWKYKIVYNESLWESFSTLALNRLRH